MQSNIILNKETIIKIISKFKFKILKALLLIKGIHYSRFHNENTSATYLSVQHDLTAMLGNI